MKRLFALAALVLGLTLATQTPASAFGVLEGLTLQSSDFDIFMPQATTLVKDGKALDEQSWSNAKSGNSGLLRILNVTQGASGPCKELELIFNLKGQADLKRYVITYCQQADGSWKS